VVLPDPARSRALLIGTSRYADSRLHDLPAVHNNLVDLRATLTGVFAERCLTVVENPTDDRAVLDTLANLAAEATDVLFVYYAGHGMLGMRQHELYFGLSSTNLDKPQYSALSLEWVRDEIRDSPARTKVLILDSCFSGRAVDDFMADEESLILGAVSVSGTYTLASSSANVASLAPTGARHTAFSGELLDLLHRGVPAGPAELDLHLVYGQLRQRMKAKGWPLPRQRGTDNVHGLALGTNPAHAGPLHEERSSERSPKWTDDSEDGRPPAEPLGPSTQSAELTRSVRAAEAKQVVSSDSDALELFVGSTIFLLPLAFFTGNAAKDVVLTVSGGGLGFWNYFALLVFTIVVGALLLSATAGLTDLVHPVVAGLSLVTVVAVGVLTHGHLWDWLDAVGAGMANLFTVDF
jgi:hypothetical protein